MSKSFGHRSDAPRVAICQPAIIYGGRLRVVIGLIETLNSMGYVPELVTGRMLVEPTRLEAMFQRPLAFKVRQVAHTSLTGEIDILSFNHRLRHIAGEYALLINTSNSLLMLPETTPVLTYLFFPRKARLLSNAVSIHQPDEMLKPFSRRGIERRLMRAIYRRLSPAPQQIICMTRFTQAAFHEAYGVRTGWPILYPPVDLPDQSPDYASKERMVVTTGRFVPDKRQLSQLALARDLPHIPFHIIGFSGDGRYLAACLRYKETHAVNNAALHPDVARDELARFMSRGRYFLHTLIGEPFGLTTVQAVAVGALPLVHDSGGQRETVPDPSLRYQSLSDIPAMLADLELDSVKRNRRQQALLSHVRDAFAAHLFTERLAPLLMAVLAGERIDD